jgi:CHAD domain-containing protein
MTKDIAWPRIRKELRWLNSALGKARDHDVTMNFTKQTRYRFWARSCRRALLRAQDKGHRSLAEKLNSARYTHLIVTLTNWITDGSWLVNSGLFRSERIDVYSQARLRDWRNRIWREGRHLRALRRKQLHRLRIQAKHYRYVVDALQTLAIKNTREDLVFYKIAKQVHRALGDLRDLKRLRKAANNRPPGYRKRKRKLLQQAEKAVRRPVRRPKHLICEGGET